VQFRGGNLLEAEGEAARARASWEEISMSMEKNIRTAPRRGCKTFAASMCAYEGRCGFSPPPKPPSRHLRGGSRRPAIAGRQIGQDGNDRGAKVIARPLPITRLLTSMWARCSRRRGKPRRTRWTMTCMWGISSQAAGHKNTAPQLNRSAERKKDAGDIIVKSAAA